MEENVKKSNGGIKILLIILIILILAVLGLESYKLFVADKKENKEPESKETEKKETETTETTEKTEETKKEASKVPAEDTFTILVQDDYGKNTNGVPEAILLTYFVLNDGKIYKYEKRLTDSCAGIALCFEYKAPFIDAQYTQVAVEGKEVKGLSNIKRLKGIHNPGTGEQSTLLLVLENGEVYSYDIQSEKITKTKFLEEYKVDDVISYNAVGGCVTDGSANFKTCGGSYHIITQDGQNLNYVVNTDGTLTAK